MRKIFRWGLFGRSFLLLVALMLANLLIWSHAHRNMSIEPQARDIADQIVTAVNITRAALVYAAPIRRRYLLMDLATNEGIRIYPRNPADRTEPMPDTALMQWVAIEINRQLGPDTQIKWSVNQLPGIWVSFSLNNDSYWVVLERTRAERTDGAQWLGWSLAALLLSLSGAALIVGFVNQPLTRLLRATQALARGEQPEKLPEDRGTDLIRDVYASFNRMVSDLDRAESDRNLMLAGISHDLRTPLARIRLELEMLPLPDEARAGIEADLSQITHILRQFMDYVQPTGYRPTVLEASNALSSLVDRERERIEAMGGRLHARIDPGLVVCMDIGDLQRVVSNVIDNARKYGRHEGEPPLLDISARRDGDFVRIELCDRGPGIPETEHEAILRPFVRGTEARTNTGGAGLGMSIVQRLVRSGGGQIQLRNRDDGGLCVTLLLPNCSWKRNAADR